MAIQELSVTDLKSKLDAKEAITLIDVREDNERELCHIGGKHIPLGQVESRLAEIPNSGTVIIYCRSGGRSGQAVAFLQQKHGYSNLINLKGGILAWGREIDPSIPQY